MFTSKPYHYYIKSFGDLETTNEATRAGYAVLALERKRRSTPYIEQARSLRFAVSEAKDTLSILTVPDIQAALLTAAGISDDAIKQLTTEGKEDAVNGLVMNYLEPAGPAFVDELVSRFLLMKEGVVGRSLRDASRVLAERKIASSMLATLSIAGVSYKWRDSRTKQWIAGSNYDVDIELYLNGLSWNVGKQFRTMLYNCTVPAVGKNVDFCLLDCAPEHLTGDTIKDTSLYLALGELKGGIDPAGADEHWKTASKALSRIRNAFKDNKQRPQIFFVGAAIQSSMAEEIWAELKNGTLGNAANLTDSNQVASLCRWLCNL